MSANVGYKVKPHQLIMYNQNIGGHSSVMSIAYITIIGRFISIWKLSQYLDCEEFKKVFDFAVANLK